MLRFCGLLLNGFFLAPKSLYDILVRSCVYFNVNQWIFCYESGGKPKSYSKLLCTYSQQTAFITNILQRYLLNTLGFMDLCVA